MQAGYVLSGLVLFRVLWGICGSYHSRFVHFVGSPISAVRYLLTLPRRNIRRYLGHNPAGACMVLVLLLALVLQVLSGLVTTNDIFWAGPLNRKVSDEVADLGGSIHHFLGDVLQILVVVHIVAVLFHQFFHRNRIIQAMFHGKKTAVRSAEPQPGTSGFSALALIIVVLISGAWVMWLFSLPL